MRQKKSILFLFINGPHHVYHLILPALKFAALDNGTESILVSGNPTNTKIINDHLSCKFAYTRLYSIKKVTQLLILFMIVF